MKALLAGFGFPYEWNPKHQAKVGLLPRNGDTKDSDIIWCSVDPCYVFHPSNAFETSDGNITLDVIAHATMFAQSTQGPDSRSSAFERWTISPSQQNVTRTVINAEIQEFPRINESYTGKTYRYAYTVALNSDEHAYFAPSSFLNKYDLIDSSRIQHHFGDDNFPSEFVFVSRQSSSAEDDGWLMGYVVNLQSQTSDLVILNAHDLSHQASIHIPSRIPSGFHGNWLAQTISAA